MVKILKTDLSVADLSFSWILTMLVIQCSVVQCHTLQLSTVQLFRDRHGRTPLWLAVSGQHLSSLHLLLQAGAEAGLRDSSGLGLEQLAREEGVREAVTAALHHTGL